jgi:hypothetical protein
LNRALLFKPGGEFSLGFRRRTAARFLGLQWSEIDDTPEIVLDAAFEDWYAIRAADHVLARRSS